jgi:hypothetical protein
MVKFDAKRFILRCIKFGIILGVLGVVAAVAVQMGAGVGFIGGMLTMFLITLRWMVVTVLAIFDLIKSIVWPFLQPAFKIWTRKPDPDAVAW